MISVDTGAAFYEVKKANSNTLKRNHANIGAQIDVIATHFKDIVEKKAAFYYLITTANVRDVSDIKKYAEQKNITFGHYVAYYRHNSDGTINVVFKARIVILGLNFDIKLPGGNNKGTKLR